MNEVLVFKTSVQTGEHVLSLAPMLDKLAGNNCWNFALDDCDRILRVVSDSVRPVQAIELLTRNGYECVELE